ncbi:hypothetical protein [Stenomitos frigidus]|uniref:hypothetical protein n=1 Tax=Stenomitos frigidus TaxID=1886765 RepID=UPI0011B1F77A|nr:hypothetical protein [Stenomitos frigidus]
MKAPNEASSRYVHPGQRLSNGQILVKRVEMSAGSAPLVILEENGIEVVRTIGMTMQTDKPASLPPQEQQFLTHSSDLLTSRSRFPCWTSHKLAQSPKALRCLGFTFQKLCPCILRVER